MKSIYPSRTPRYTSYPPVPNWNLKLPDLDKIQGGVDLYIHIPYCKELCYYCGCHRVISKNQSRSTQFLEYLLKEWALIRQNLGEFKINSLHFGGGTPTFLTPEDFEQLFSVISPHFKDDYIGAVEVDPRTTSLEHLAVFQKYGIRRISMGIQDFDYDVQTSINRNQSFELVAKLVRDCRQYGIEHINFDLIYGLPKQTLQGMQNTLEKVKALAPDMIACYGYAHLPHINKNQNLIKAEELPPASLRQQINDLIARFLKEEGYIEIGMDHYAKESSYLYRAVIEKRLLRNFMGYTDRKSEVMIGMGPSAISAYPAGHAQNIKEIKDYFSCLDRDELPLFKGHQYNPEDKKRESIIQNIMCNGFLNKDSLSLINDRKKQAIVDEMVHDAILVEEPDHFRLEDKDYSRVLAVCFDEYYSIDGNQKFSTTV
jgi:oxygen-independent coproporphyrinogen-3 oxidase